ncbi:hypothetical protein ABMA27_011403 [Loxostege sticticalis]|uniref:FP protein C-terminal domain-containing protein n=1 Tax=Loxostege sticticalis TaxID=481309 RepID=A0ABR3IG48_LOXSC
MPLRRTPPASPAPTAAGPALTAPACGPAPEPIIESTPGPSAAPAPAAARPLLSMTALANTLGVSAVHGLHSCSSEPNLSDSFNVTQRKRKRSDCIEDTLNCFMDEMKQMFKDFTEEQDRKYNRLCNTVEDIRTSLDLMAEKHVALQVKVEKLEAERKADCVYIRSLEDRLDYLEKNSRSTHLEIRNIPAPSAESKTTLLDTFINTAKVLKVPLQHNDIKDIFRINTKKSTNSTIIVNLASVLHKEKIITSFRQFNKGVARLTTEHLHISGPPTPIYISENLTAKMKKLFYLAREFAKANEFKFCWVSHGKVFLRKKENAPLIRVANDDDLIKLQDKI